MNMAQWLSWLERRPVTAEVEGSSPFWVVCIKLQTAERAKRFLLIAERAKRFLLIAERAKRDVCQFYELPSRVSRTISAKILFIKTTQVCFLFR